MHKTWKGCSVLKAFPAFPGYLLISGLIRGGRELETQCPLKSRAYLLLVHRDGDTEAGEDRCFTASLLLKERFFPELTLSALMDGVFLWNKEFLITPTRG